MNLKRNIPIRENLWLDTLNGPRLIGSKCPQCGELYFPRKENNLCTYCQSMNLEDFQFSTKGKIYSHTSIMQRPPVYYRGEVPYSIGYVELPEGIRIETLFTGCDIEKIHVGMDVELVVEKLHEHDDGKEVVTYKFRPIA